MHGGCDSPCRLQRRLIDRARQRCPEQLIRRLLAPLIDRCRLVFVLIRSRRHQRSSEQTRDCEKRRQRPSDAEMIRRLVIAPPINPLPSRSSFASPPSSSSYSSSTCSPPSLPPPPLFRPPSFRSPPPIIISPIVLLFTSLHLPLLPAFLPAFLLQLSFLALLAPPLVLCFALLVIYPFIPPFLLLLSALQFLLSSSPFYSFSPSSTPSSTLPFFPLNKLKLPPTFLPLLQSSYSSFSSSSSSYTLFLFRLHLHNTLILYSYSIRIRIHS